MPEIPVVTTSAAVPEDGSARLLTVPASSALPSENHATPTQTAAEASRAKLRSCVTCRTRKVRCDKGSPCSNCRRAKIPCVVPSLDKPPRWARRLERVANSAKAEQDAVNARAEHDVNAASVTQVMERLRSLESLVKELSSELEQARAAASASGGGSSTAGHSPESSNQDTDHHAESSSDVSNMQKQFGRLVLGDSSRSRYVSSGFWSRVHDELDSLKMETEGLATEEYESSDSDGSLGKPLSTQELDRTPSERHAFIFRHNLGWPTPNLHEFHPSPSQVPFLLYVFSENINIMLQIVHIPTVNKMMGDLRDNDVSTLTPANQALMFSIYYAAITSMEEDDIMANFGFSKFELSLKYRLGLEHALAKADFISVPDLVTLQAFTIFIFLVRRHDSPRFVWMMTGLAVRMAHALGLHRDGSRFPHLTLFEVEMRRRLWWAICMLDVRTSEDQDTDLTVIPDSFDTRVPLNINDTDIEPGRKEQPQEREGVTDMVFALASCYFCDTTRRIMATSLKGGTPSLDEKVRILNEFQIKMEQKYLYNSSGSGNIFAFWTEVTIARLFVSKMTLINHIAHLPTLISSPGEEYSDEIRAKLFVAAIEVTEYNHALNAEQACRQWRWIFQTYTHWHSIVYLLLAITRRPWSPIVERAWVDLHSTWLIPPQSKVDKNLPIWIPLRKLMTKARVHREAELERLCRDPHAAQLLEAEDRCIPQPASPGPFPGADSAESFRERWRQLLKMPPGRRKDIQVNVQSASQMTASPNLVSPSEIMPSVQPVYLQPNLPQGHSVSVSNVPELNSNMVNDVHSQAHSSQPTNSPYNPLPSAPVVPTDWSLGAGFGTWLWADADPSVDVFANMNYEATDLNMDFDSDVDWNNWVNSAKGVEFSGEASGAGWA
ncbi:fungal-specific transcription factor domain-containing protein [Hypoxylon rubiginosum]|uniref:Fungal-specific transcription factor domain-containing protein n=1 Tax=Hypoxylon rubiginosum TaxID=110542 RepID=A0ACB9YIM9_9PEZI|nr:fungal-specific transcription factor domain-containing protein [Hypoxylon rubiginosum]